MALTGTTSTLPSIPNIFLSEFQDREQNNTRVWIVYFVLSSIFSDRFLISNYNISAMCTKGTMNQTTLCAIVTKPSPRNLSDQLAISETLAQDVLLIQRTLFPSFLAAAGMFFPGYFIGLTFEE